MRVILSFVLYVFVQTICFGDELPYGLRDKNIPKDYLVSNWFSADINSDGRDDYFVVLDKRVDGKTQQQSHVKDRLAIIFISQKDDSYTELERNSISVSCESCEYGYSIENFSSPTKITSWIPDQNSSVHLAAYIPAEIASFVEKGYRINSWASADLNGDKLIDYLVVEEKQKNSPDEADIKSKQRPLLILVRQADQSLKLIKRNDIAVSCSTCSPGGMTIEGYYKITAKSNSFSIVNQSGGSAFHRIYTHTFGYSKRDNTWQLIRVEDKAIDMHTLEDDSVDTYTPPKDFGKIDFSDFDPESYLGNGEGYQPPKKKKRH